MVTKVGLRTGQVAAILGVSPATVKRWCADKKLPTTRLPGGHYRITHDAVATFLNELARQVGVNDAHQDGASVAASAERLADTYADEAPRHAARVA